MSGIRLEKVEAGSGCGQNRWDECKINRPLLAWHLKETERSGTMTCSEQIMLSMH